MKILKSLQQRPAKSKSCINKVMYNLTWKKNQQQQTLVLYIVEFL